jgi:DNA polymerase III subunit epsilon
VRDHVSLTSRAAALLKGGAAHTLDLAREVLGMSGHAGAASAAVFTLLGRDPRFHLDREGWWSLAGEPPDPAEELDRLVYAVADVETTGGSPERGHRITEVAVVEMREGAISGEFQTLVNPGRPIPRRVSELTGITDAMVAGAPFFEDVAHEVFARLDGRVFVAHNAPFDWRFLSYQLGDSLGSVPQGPRLCTLQLARRLAPGLSRRNLDALATHFGVPIHVRHRAHGDALATARVLLRLLDEARAAGARDLTSLRLILERKRAT